MGRVTAVCISKERGTVKTAVSEIKLIKDFGIEGDAHAGSWHRQVSLLSYARIEEFRQKVPGIRDGTFGENMIAEGIDLRTLPVGTRLKIGDAVLQITQIGKECHTGCTIYRKTGDCIMPREGIFAKVIEGGVVKPGMEIDVIGPDPKRPYTAAWITLSDRSAAGQREDKSGPLIGEIVSAAGMEVVEGLLLPDDVMALKKALIRLSDQRQVDLILTTGGTGLSIRDVTPETTEAVCDRMVPGISEAIRAYSMTKTDKAMLSRAVSGIRGRTLIINLPGSPKAVKECLEFVLPPIFHGLGVLTGREGY